LREKDIVEQAQIKKSVLQLERDAGRAAAGSPEYNEIQNKLISRKRDLERSRTALKQNVRYYHNFNDTTIATIPQVRKDILKDHSMMLELFTGDSAIYSLLITNSSLHFDKINKAAYDRAMQAVMTCISDPVLQNRQVDVFAKNAAALYQLIFRGRTLPHGRIIISTDGNNFPFEALVTNNSVISPSYFISDYAVSYTYSARYLLNSFFYVTGSYGDFSAWLLLITQHVSILLLFGEVTNLFKK